MSAPAQDPLAARAEAEAQLLARAYSELGDVLTPVRAVPPPSGGDATVRALRLVGEALGVELTVPATAPASSDTIEAIASASGIRTRRVALDERWWRRAADPLLGRTVGGDPVALLPRRWGGYDLADAETGVRRRVTAKVAAGLARTAVVLYRPLPPGRLGNREVRRFVLRPLVADLRVVGAYGVLSAALSLATPLATKRIFGTVVPEQQRASLVWLSSLVAVFAVAAFGFAVVQQLALLRIQGRATSDLQAALWDRLLDLPLPFFQGLSSGRLTMRVLGVQRIHELATAAIGTAALAVPIGLANLVLAFVLAPRLALFGLVAVVLVAAAAVALYRYRLPRQRRLRAASGELFGLAMQLVGAVAKLRTADAERRAYAQWALRFAAAKRSFYDAQLGYAATIPLTAAAGTLATVLFFLGAATLPVGAIPGSTFVAFDAAFLQVIAAAAGLVGVATFLADAVPIYDSAKPILETPRETHAARGDPGTLRGAVEVSNVTLRYGDGPPVLDDVSFGVEPGRFLALVGPSGAGKSSLLRVLLGFELPEVGSVSFDGNDLAKLDVRAVRRQLGVVVQSAQLLPADVFTNIVGTRPLTLDDAWRAARIAGLAEAIERMPMGMHTLVGEGTGTLSGGERQRLLIARAIAGAPRILLLDEATSALDNRTQRQVSEALERLAATRIVIAHRLSTIRAADEIVVLDGGRVVQRGTYDELVARDGLFRDLAARQLAD